MEYIVFVCIMDRCTDTVNKTAWESGNDRFYWGYDFTI